MPKDYLFRLKLVMDIAGIDPAIFNKIVADDFYYCAPKAEVGKARPFTQADVIGVCFLQHFLQRGMTARLAGELACEFLRCHRSNPSADRIVRIFGQVGNRTMTGEEFDKLSIQTPLRGVGRIVSVEMIIIAHFQQIIAERVAEELRTLGDEE